MKKYFKLQNWIILILISVITILSLVSSHYTLQFTNYIPEEEEIIVDTEPPTTPPTIPESTECSHQYNNGECIFCHVPCPHQFENGVCQLCHFVCPHEQHDENLICSTCGEHVYHNYENGKCTICGKEPILFHEMISDEWLQPCDEQGTIEFVDLKTAQYEPRPYLIYKPFGYNENTKYNVIVLLHGDHGDQHDWLDRIHIHGLTQWKLVDLFDNMIKHHLCEPFIVVSPNYLGWHNVMTYDKFGEEMKNFFLPHLVNTYSTYAENGDYESLVAARDHFALGGLSRGAMFTYWSSLPQCIDVSGNFVLLSGGLADENIYKKIKESGQDLNYLYLSCGIADNANGAKHLYEGFMTKTDLFTADQNIRLDVLDGLSHEWGTWTTGIFNALQLIF